MANCVLHKNLSWPRVIIIAHRPPRHFTKMIHWASGFCPNACWRENPLISRLQREVLADNMNFGAGALLSFGSSWRRRCDAEFGLEQNHKTFYAVFCKSIWQHVILNRFNKIRLFSLLSRIIVRSNIRHTDRHTLYARQSQLPSLSLAVWFVASAKRRTELAPFSPSTTKLLSRVSNAAL